MTKSKIATIGFIIGIAIYVSLRNVIIHSLDSYIFVYTYIINPAFWIILAILMYKLLGKDYENKKLKKEITEYTLIACLIYILTYLISGLFVTFGRNPYSRTLIGILKNTWEFGSVLVAREYIRYRLINNVHNKDKMLITVLVTALFTLVDFEIWKKFSGTNITAYYYFAVLFRDFIPIVTKNALFSYLAYNKNFTSAIIYDFTTNLYLRISPILPNTPWIMDAFIDTVIPLILLLYIRFTKNKLDRFRTREKIINSDPRSIIPMVIIIILVVWFAIGVFPIKPIAIASGSMEKTLFVGDVAIVKKCGSNDINVGDIIEYKLDNITVIHRVIEKYQTKGEFYFRTKGDNNALPDLKIVHEGQLIGKVIYKVRYLGYPAIWLNLFRQEEALEIER